MFGYVLIFVLYNILIGSIWIWNVLKIKDEHEIDLMRLRDEILASDDAMYLLEKLERTADLDISLIASAVRDMIITEDEHELTSLALIAQGKQRKIKNDVARRILCQ